MPGTLFVIVLALQNFHLGQFLDLISDEGVYLYAAKLISLGSIPYKDFFLAHPPFSIVLIALFFKITQTNIPLFHFLYTAWCFTCIFPLYVFGKRLTDSRLASLLSLLVFVSYPGLVVLNTREFALRAFSLPFLAFFLYVCYERWHPKAAALLLSLFALVLVSNAVIAYLFVVLFLAEKYKGGKQPINCVVKQYQSFILLFLAITVSYYGVLWLIPWTRNNIFSFQVTLSLIQL